MVPIVVVAIHIGLVMVNGATAVVDSVVVVVDVVVANFVVLALLDVAYHITFSCGQSMLI